jgi:hypothetical protein
MSNTPLEDESLGLMLKDYRIVANSALMTKIAVYTPYVIETILSEHHEVLDKWLKKLHNEFVSSKKSCELEHDPVACFNISIYEEAEKRYNTWKDGGLVVIDLPDGAAIRVRNTLA